MPFPVSHCAVVLPCVRVCARHGAVSALIIGSMVPDLSYFIPWPRTGYGSHSLMGLVTFCVPVGLVSVASFEFILRRPLVFLLPAPLRDRLGQSNRSQLVASPRAAAVVLLSLMGTALVHIAWDAIGSRQNTLFGPLSWTQPHLFTAGGYDVHVYTLIQHLGSLVGGALVLWAVRDWYHRQAVPGDACPDIRDQRFRAVSLVSIAAFSLAAGWYGGVRHELPDGWLRASRYFLHRGAVWGVQIGGLATSAYVVAWWMYFRDKQDGRPPDGALAPTRAETTGSGRQ